MLLDRLHHAARTAGSSASHVDEHRAVVDLLVLTAYADHTIDTAELDDLEAFDAAHGDWDEATFSVQQYLPEAIAKVRHALDQPDGAAALLQRSTSTLIDPALRAEAVRACEHLAAAGDSGEAERTFVDDVRAALA